MPLPRPSKGEKQKNWMSRCMGDDVMRLEYGDEEQRAAVCHSVWDRSHKKDGLMAKNAAQGYEQLRRKLSEALEATFPCPPGGGGWPWLLDFYPDEGFLLARFTFKGEYDLYRVTYAIGDDGDVEFTGDPDAVDEKYALRDTGKIIARQLPARQLRMQAKLIAAGDTAAQYLDTLVEKNPLFASLKGTPNTHLVVMDLTTIGKPSQHAGSVKYQLAKAGLAAALPTLISKPIHVTAAFDAHFDGDPKPIGVFLGGEGISNADGTITLRAIGTLWKDDFPSEIEEIIDKRADLGASYEITYNPLAASRIARDVIELSEYQFSGGAILKKKAAAHPETNLLVAGYRTLDGTDLAATWYRGSAREAINAILADDNLDVLDEGVAASVHHGSGDITFSAEPITTKERDALPDSDFALVQKVKDTRTGEARKVRRFPIDSEARRKNAWARLGQSQVATDLSESERNQVKDRVMNRAKREGDAWAKPYKKSNGTWVKGGTAMASKYLGFDEEQAALIDTIVTAALKASETSTKVEELTVASAALKTELGALKAEHTEMKKKHDDMAKEHEAVKAQLLEKSKELEIHQTAAKEATERLEAVELKTKVDAKLAELGQKYGFDEKALIAKRPLVEKLVAGKEPIKPEEMDEILAGAKVVLIRPVPTVPLHAASGEGDGGETVDREKILNTFPNLRRHIPAQAR